MVVNPIRLVGGLFLSWFIARKRRSDEVDAVVEEKVEEKRRLGIPSLLVTLEREGGGKKKNLYILISTTTNGNEAYKNFLLRKF